MDRSPLVSVYLPTRDRPALLERAVRSVFAQTYRNIQLVVADDGSQAQTGEILTRLCTENGLLQPMVVLRQDRSEGACRARNRALEACKGTYVSGLDDDDYFLPQRIERLIAAFDPELDAFAYDGYIRETILPAGRARRVRIPLGRPASLGALLKRNVVGNQVFTLTERLHAVGGYDARLPAWQDYDLWIRLVRAFGPGRPAGGVSYVHVVDQTLPRISGDPEKVGRAFDVFLEKHPEYADPRLLLCLRLAKASYGIDELKVADMPGLLRLGEPRYVLFAMLSYLSRRRDRGWRAQSGKV